MERNQSSRLPWAIVLLVVAFCCGISYLVGSLIHSQSEKTSVGNAKAIQVDNLVKLETLSDGFVTFNGSTLAKINASGNVDWSYYFASSYDFDASNAGVAAYSDKALTLFDRRGEITFAGTLDSEVLSARVGSVYAAVELGPNHDSTILLMEPTGRTIDSISLPDQTVVDYGFFYNDTLLWIMTLDANGTVPSCTISTYRPGRRQVGSIGGTEQIIYHCSFTSSTIVCVGENFIEEYDYTGSENTAKRMLIYGWTLAACDDTQEHSLMAFTPAGQFDGRDNIHDVRLVRGSNSRVIRLPFGATYMYTRGNTVYAFSSDGHIMSGSLNSQQVLAYQLGWTFDEVYGIINNDTAVIRSGNLVCLVKLQ